jgi:glycosyltransferase involved in cell wall biosynthesis
MKKILSIIIPSYNTANYIDNTIPTMISTESIDDIEIIIVNDGSTDETREKALKYVSRYPDSIKLVNKENGGHGSVINCGIIEAKGKYFKVIDGDDYVDTEQFDCFVKQLKDVDADMFVSLYRTVDSKTGEERICRPDGAALVRHEFKKHYDTLYKTEEVLDNIYASIHGVTFRTDILKKNYDFVKVTEGVFYEDNEYCLYPIAFVKNIFVSGFDVYRYVINQANQSISIKNRQKKINHNYMVINNMLKHYAVMLENGLNDKYINYAIRAISRQVYGVFEVYFTYTDDVRDRKRQLRQFDNEIKVKYYEVYNDANYYKAIRILRKTNYTLFAILGRYYRSRLG